ncbi:hypothetical protein JCM10212_006242 [Sporobolomyces blumeae]
MAGERLTPTAPRRADDDLRLEGFFLDLDKAIVLLGRPAIPREPIAAPFFPLFKFLLARSDPTWPRVERALLDVFGSRHFSARTIPNASCEVMILRKVLGSVVVQDDEISFVTNWLARIVHSVKRTAELKDRKPASTASSTSTSASFSTTKTGSTRLRDTISISDEDDEVDDLPKPPLKRSRYNLAPSPEVDSKVRVRRASSTFTIEVPLRRPHFVRKVSTVPERKPTSTPVEQEARDRKGKGRAVEVDDNNADSSDDGTGAGETDLTATDGESESQKRHAPAEEQQDGVGDDNVDSSDLSDVPDKSDFEYQDSGQGEADEDEEEDPVHDRRGGTVERRATSVAREAPQQVRDRVRAVNDLALVGPRPPAPSAAMSAAERLVRETFHSIPPDVVLAPPTTFRPEPFEAERGFTRKQLGGALMNMFDHGIDRQARTWNKSENKAALLMHYNLCGFFLSPPESERGRGGPSRIEPFRAGEPIVLVARPHRCQDLVAATAKNEEFGKFEDGINVFVKVEPQRGARRDDRTPNWWFYRGRYVVAFDGSDSANSTRVGLEDPPNDTMLSILSNAATEKGKKRDWTDKFKIWGFRNTGDCHEGTQSWDDTKREAFEEEQPEEGETPRGVAFVVLRCIGWDDESCEVWRQNPT